MIHIMLALALCLTQSAAQAPPPPVTQDAHSHHDGVTARGDHAMGFSHETTTHHFLLSKTGGTIEVSANNSKDTSTRDEIRMHFSHIVKRFAAGDFNVPMFIHDTVPPGAPQMAKLRDQIRYQYAETPAGAAIRITTANPDGVQAIHSFLRFQISDHQTGDPTEVQARQQ